MLSLDISISLSAAFQGSTSTTNIEAQNPGLERDLFAHEEGYRGQIMDADNEPVTIYFTMEGELVNFSGRPDKVIENASNVFMRSTQASYLTTAEKETFISDNISRNIDAVKAVLMSKKMRMKGPSLN